MRATTGFALLFGIVTCACSGHQTQDVQTGIESRLHRAASCTDLEAMLKADAHLKVNAYVDQQVAGIQRNGYYYGTENGAPMTAGAGGADGSSSGGSGKSAPSASDFSQTDLQVQGVDEADIVKNDGRFVYLLHGQSFVVINAWPVTSLGTQSSLTIEGSPIEMFVSDGKAVIYSTVDGTAVYAAAGIPSRPVYKEYGGYGYAYSGAADVAPGGYYVPNAMPLSKITVVGLADGKPSVEREIYFEGSYLSSRRVGSHVRTVLTGGARGPVLQSYPQVPPTTPSVNGQPPTPEQLQQQQAQWINAWEQLRAANNRLIDATTASDWVPYQMVKNGTAVTAKMTACQDFYMPTTGTTQYGLAQVEAIDLAKPNDPPTSTVIGGGVDTVYANGDSMYLAQRGWNESNYYVMGGMGGPAGGAPVSAGTVGTGGVGTKDFTYGIRYDAPVTMNWTHLHKFEFASDPSFANYVASGTVVGQVVNQFSLDDSGGNLRITTTEQRAWLTPPTKPGQTMAQPAPITTTPLQQNHLFVLTENAGSLATIGDAGSLAPGEQIYSTRFIGNRGYVVTFREMDPLFVVDLSNPSAPTVLAELTIPGFSSYMEPLDEGHLLTIGQDTKAGHCAGCVAPAGVDLQVFDVTDARNPKLTSKFTFDGYGATEAQTDHRAFTYFADRQLLAFPYYGYSTSAGTSTMKSTLEVFHVDAATGISKLGSIDHSSLFGNNAQGYCGGYFNPQVRRGVFLENVAYSISYAGVIAKDVSALDGAGQVLTLPQPELPGYPACGGGAPTPAGG